MSKAQNTDGETVEQEVNKTVTVMAYLKEQGYESKRECAADIDDRIDYFDKYEDESHDYFIVDGKEKVEITEDLYERMANKDTGELIVRKVTETETNYSWGVNKAAKNTFGDTFEELECMQEGKYETTLFGVGIKEPDGDNLCSVYRSLEHVPMLKHQSEIDGEDVYVDESESYYAIQLRFRMNGVTEETAEEVTDEFVEPAIKGVAKHPLVQKIRVMDCETKKTEKGACFRV